MRRLDTTEEGFEAKLRALLQRDEAAVAGISDSVRNIIADVRGGGDAKLVELTRKLDRTDLSCGLAVTEQEVEQAIAACSKEALDALEIAARRIEAYHDRQRPEDRRWIDDLGVTLGWRWTPLDAVGLYVPGGTAAYPSSVLMNAIPAKVAGVKRIVIVTPAREGKLNPLVLAAAKRAGVTEIYKIGGAQAVAALAYGTETIKPVDKIVGPGNAYVAEAKRQVFGHVGIDSIAGPSEITVIAEGGIEASHIAADLLSQTEHDKLSQSILLCCSEVLASAVAKAVEDQLAEHPRREIAETAWREQGAIIMCEDLADAARVSNIIAPEHLELCVRDPEALLPLIDHAGAVFLGRHTPEAIGDYVGGPSHVLPTSRAARFSSGLSVLDFVKRMSVTGCPEKAFREIGPVAATLAEIEGLPSHAASVTFRLEE
ncbi:histidinol dehydrogenase [Parvularcula lutaonensis]|uniref:Histidinol dehydrogenase n=1 Tax=Parvularcula lutaonensis TaxID=491923 RepID=A0ABV7ME58_9PROT|nr:histidinol dehydrogenase [Parvularcula lutaonensis]GGY54666.1 histidinol dehydrogenase 1 [Parvularcula lutaonensis]